MALLTIGLCAGVDLGIILPDSLDAFMIAPVAVALLLIRKI